jgi:hypothetical protein
MGFAVWRGTFRCGTSEPLVVPPEATDFKWVDALPMRKLSFGSFGYQSGEEVTYVDLFSIGRRGFVHEYDRVRRVMFPAWAVILITAPLPARRIIRWLGKVRARTRVRWSAT